jgi:isopentenyl-diphosphate Delta-isomerase
MTRYEGVTELVVLLDDQGHAIGTAPKDSVHDRDTRLHLAFSCYVFNPRGELLTTRRALGKPTWPGVWTNTVCGHPGPGESLLAAARRRSRDELGIDLVDLRVVLPAFRYRAVMANGIVENELCPVTTARTHHEPAVDPAEVAATAWVPWPEFRDSVIAGGRDVSPWCRDQVVELDRLGADPRGWPAATDDGLPPAARTR